MSSSVSAAKHIWFRDSTHAGSNETNGAGTNLNVEGEAGTDPAQNAGQKFSFVPLHFFGSKSTFSRFGERWSVQFDQFLVCCSSTHGRCPPRVQPFVKWGHVPPCPRPMESEPLNETRTMQFILDQ